MWMKGLCLAIVMCAVLAGAARAQVPRWLQAHVGYEDGQIAPVVLERARALHAEKLKARQVRNPCYLAMDATRPSTRANGQATKRFYIICEQSRSFRALSSGYGNGRKLPQANFSNGRQCARHFGNAEGSNLTTGGAYITAETRNSFKGYVTEGGKRRPFYRTFLLFDGEGDTRNARARASGGHQATFLRWQCRMKRPQSRHADAEGYVPYGRLVDYASGRSNGCTTWSEDGTKDVLKVVKNNPTTLYIYPESHDIAAVAKAVTRGRALSSEGLYWDASCLSSIGAPQFWHKRKLQPIINRWRRSLPKREPKPLPICK